MKLLEFIFLGIFDQLAGIVLSVHLVGIKAVKVYKVFVFMILMALASSVMSWMNSLDYYFIPGIGVTYFIFLWLYKQKWMDTLYLTIITSSLLALIQFIIIMVLRFWIDLNHAGFLVGMFAQLIFFMMAYVVATKLRVDVIYRFVKDNNKIFKLMLMNLFTLIALSILYWKLESGNFLEKSIMMSSVITLVLALNLVFYKKGLENEFERKQLEVQAKYLKILEELIDEIRMIQHGFDNQIQGLNMALKLKGDQEPQSLIIEDFIQDLNQKNQTSQLIKLENKILAGLLYSKKNEAKQRNIEFSICIQDPLIQTKLKDYEVIEVVGNLIDNAFEAQSGSAKVRFELYKADGKSVICVKNSHPFLNHTMITECFKKGVSTKGNGRGLRLHAISKIINYYQGEILVSNVPEGEENYVVFEVRI
ncbi:sensor histidine kinase [Fusibacter ferrireducens]|uniref:GHKL domain-containing protein n=1 Tax=Fusibacter ferrireducens TaxID=2785058 RepID=A0ABR9ZSB2_9FIRM|nr:ATP-binding protein [Fusibacter ferrireducens]MBF4693353.1 GHKL domain-containing protein [Fusibacter ferrireducens]